MFKRKYSVSDIRRKVAVFASSVEEKWWAGVEEHGETFSADPIHEGMQEVRDQFWFLTLAEEERAQLRDMLVKAHNIIQEHSMNAPLVIEIQDYFEGIDCPEAENLILPMGDHK